MRKRRNKSSKVAPKVIISLCALISMYLGTSLYFSNHFYFGSVIDGVNATGKTVEEVEKEIASKIETYKLELEGRNDEKEEINGSDIDLKYCGGKVQEVKDNQNSFAWIISIFNEKDVKLSETVTYDENLLKESVEKLSYFNSKDIIKPESANFKYTENGYEIVDEVLGNKVDKENLSEKVAKSISNIEPKLNLESANCYENPKYNSKSSEVAEAKNVLDKYVASKVTYTFGDRTEVLDGSTIHSWLDVNENMEVIVDEKKARNYVNKISGIYNTFGSTRDFVTASKATIKVSGGNYGWIVDKSKETKELIDAIKTGQATNREPVYSQTALSRDGNDIGNTYVELDLSKQHLWFYKKGALIVEGDFVSGNVSNNLATPAGTYRLNYKEKNATLKGENYSSPVDFWMPFNNNIGLHDASWRTQFGKEIYKTSGSHGCVNLPRELARAIFENIEAGTPIVCY